MTRINIVSVKGISNKQLMAEYHESIRVFGYVLKSKSIPSDIPSHYCLGKGHVKFFFNKIPYLLNRYKEINQELTNRGYKLNNETFTKNLEKGKLALQKYPEIQRNDWTPSLEEMMVNQARIDERLGRILMKRKSF
jgi:deoxyribonuclease (pyrimidine dimer)